MRPASGNNPATPPHGSRLLLALAAMVLFALLGGVAAAGDLNDELDRKKGQLGKVRERQGS